MPKFYKKNILAHQSNDSPLSLPETPVPVHNVMPVQPESHFSSLPHPEESLLSSPLDIPELMPPHNQSNPLEAPTLITESAPTPELPHTPPPSIHSTPITPEHPTTSTNTAPIPESHLVQTLLSWRAPSRPHRKKDRSFYTTVAILIILIAMIALLAGERMLVAVLFALMFLVYVLNFIEPQEIEFKLSTQGVTIDEHFYHWQELDSFWFEKKDGYIVLHILTQLRFPSMLMLVLGPNTTEEEVKRTTARFLPFHEIAPKSMIDKWAQSLQRYFPLENPHK
jgi:hypothetical protein